MKKEIKKADMKGIVGVSGEFFVAAELSQRGIVATMTMKNTPSIDILAANLSTGQAANIQVKTMSIGNNAGWRLGKKDENSSGIANHYYVFVDLKGPGILPEYIIVPQNELAKLIKKLHKKWLSGTKKDGSARKDTDIRTFDPNRNKDCKKLADEYRDNWDTLGLWPDGSTKVK